MRRYADLADALACAPNDTAAAGRLAAYLRATPVPERGFALRLLLGKLDLRVLGAARLRQVAEVRIDRELLRLAAAHAGTLTEAVGLAWPGAGSAEGPTLLEIVTELQALQPTDAPSWLARRLDDMPGPAERLALLDLSVGRPRALTTGSVAWMASAQLGDPQDLTALLAQIAPMVGSDADPVPPAAPAVPHLACLAALYVERIGVPPGDRSELTVGAWAGSSLVPIGRAQLDLPPAERAALDEWIRANAGRRHGPVRELPPTLAVTVAFDGVDAAPRRKAGLVLRAPRVRAVRWDEPIGGTATLGVIAALLPS